jgi:hypothetical protein
MGVVGANGYYQVYCDTTQGAPAGNYNVLIEWRDDPSAANARGNRLALAAAEKAAGKTAQAAAKAGVSRVRPPDRLKGKYLDHEHPLLSATIEPRGNDLAAFELKD